MENTGYNPGEGGAYSQYTWQEGGLTELHNANPQKIMTLKFYNPKNTMGVNFQPPKNVGPPSRHVSSPPWGNNPMHTLGALPYERN